MHEVKARPAGKAAARSNASERTWVRTRPTTSKRATLGQATTLARNLRRDSRFAQLTVTGRYVLTVAAMEYANRDGGFYIKQQQLADDCGVSRSAVNAAIQLAEELGIIEQTHYLRPVRRGQGASNYAFAAEIVSPGVANDDTQVSHPDGPGVAIDDTQQGVALDDTRQGVATDDTLMNEERLNEEQVNVSPASFGSNGGDLTVADEEIGDDDVDWITQTDDVFPFQLPPHVRLDLEASVDAA